MSVLLQVLVQPFALEIVTEYVDAELTVIHCVVAPVLHKYEDIPAGAHHCVDPPAQTDPLPVIAQVGSEFTVNVLLQLLVQPFPSTVVTEYVLAELTVIHWVVAPVLHR